LADLDDETQVDHVRGLVLPPTPNPEQVAARAEIRRMVECAVDALGAPYRLVCVMRVIDQMSIEETAAALNIPAATVKARLHRANHQLRETLGSELAAALEGVLPFAGASCDRLTRVVMERLAEVWTSSNLRGRRSEGAP
jgi:RNA polymerase sigma-70 factor, ECF subfamily